MPVAYVVDMGFVYVHTHYNRIIETLNINEYRDIDMTGATFHIYIGHLFDVRCGACYTSQNDLKHNW